MSESASAPEEILSAVATFVRREFLGGLSLIVGLIALFEGNLKFTLPVDVLLGIGGLWTLLVIVRSLKRETPPALPTTDEAASALAEQLTFWQETIRKTTERLYPGSQARHDPEFGEASHLQERNELRKEGAVALTPAIETVGAINSAAVSIGTQEEITERMRARVAEWEVRRTSLRTYLNQHPSDEIRQQGLDAIQAVETSISAVLWLFQSQRQPNVYQAFQDANARHDEAKRALDALMDAIRTF